MRIAGAVLIRDRGDRPQFVRGYDSVRVPQPQHERVLRRRDVEKAVKFVEEDVGALRKLALGRIRRDLVPHVERVFGALGFLLLGQLAARGENSVLRGEMDALRSRGLGAGGCGQRTARRRETAAEPVEVELLFFGEIHLNSA